MGTYGNGAGTGIAVVRLQAGRIRRVARLAVTASYAEVVGSTMRTTLLVRIGTAAAPTASATAFWAFGWFRALDEKCTSVYIFHRRDDMFLITGKCGTLI